MRHSRTVQACAAVMSVGGAVWAATVLLPARAGETSPSRQAAPGGDGEAAPRRVEVVAPQRRPMSRLLDVPGTIEAFERAEVYAKISGFVAEVRVDIGDRVQAGDVLALLDVPEMADELRQAESVRAARSARVEALRAKARQAELVIETARAEQAARAAELVLQEATARRQEELFANQAIAEQGLDEARSKLAIARAQREIATARLASTEGDKAAADAEVDAALAEVGVADASMARLKTLMEYAVLRAPFDGLVTRRAVDRGVLVQAATVSRSMPLFVVERVDRFRIFIDVPESDVAFVRPGAPARVTPYGLPGRSFTAAVARTARSLDTATRTMRTEIDLENPEADVLGGMYVQVTLELDLRSAALTVPAGALLNEGKEAYVFTVRDGRAVRTPVQTGLDDGIHVEITQGLGEESLVIVTGKNLVTDGMPVTAVQAGSRS